jgi:hypothetical protein
VSRIQARDHHIGLENAVMHRRHVAGKDLGISRDAGGGLLQVTRRGRPNVAGHRRGIGPTRWNAGTEILRIRHRIAGVVRSQGVGHGIPDRHKSLGRGLDDAGNREDRFRNAHQHEKGKAHYINRLQAPLQALKLCSKLKFLDTSMDQDLASVMLQQKVG